MNETIAILTHAYTLIKKGWTRKCFARNKHSKAVTWDSEQACRFCAVGAIKRATHNLFPKDTHETKQYKSNTAIGLLREHALDQGYKSTVRFNDCSTKAEVLNAIKQVINAVKS